MRAGVIAVLMRGRRAYAAFMLLAVALCMVEALVAGSSSFARHPDVLSFAVAFDIFLCVPGLYYLLLVRTRRAPAPSLVFVFVVCLYVAGAMLPPQHQSFLGVVRAGLPLVELAIVGMFVFRTGKAVRYYREELRSAIYPSDAMRAAVARAMGANLATTMVTSELSLMYYSLFGWFKRFKPLREGDLAFTYHRKSAYGALLVLIVLLTPLETLAVHLLVSQWSSVAAWVLTALGAYSLLWLLGDFAAIRLHPIVLSGDYLYIRTGLRARVTVPLGSISKVRKASAADQKSPHYARMTIIGQASLVLELTQPVRVQGPFGRRKDTMAVGLTMDDERRFRQELDRARNVI